MVSVESVADILHDAEGTLAAGAVLARFEHLRPVEAPLQTGPVLGCASYLPVPPVLDGAEVMSLVSPQNKTRYKTLRHVEQVFPPDGDFGMLIVPACQILETELEVRLLSPIRQMGNRLAVVLRAAGDTKQAAIIDKWAIGELPATIGTCCLVLLALRRGAERDDDDVRQFLREEFEPPFCVSLQKGHLCAALNRVRAEFRNPACHGQTTFDMSRYAEFVELLVTARSFAEFHNAVVASDNGLLVAHLLHHRGQYQYEQAKREKEAERLRRALMRTWRCPVCSVGMLYDDTSHCPACSYPAAPPPG